MKDKNLSSQVYKKEPLLVVIKQKTCENIRQLHEFHLRPVTGPEIFANQICYTTSLTILAIV